MIGAGHLDAASLRVRMVERQRATPRKRVRFRSLSWIEVDAGRGLSAPIVHSIIEMNRTTGAIGRDMKEGRIGHGQVGTAGNVRNRSRCYRHTD